MDHHELKVRPSVLKYEKCVAFLWDMVMRCLGKSSITWLQLNTCKPEWNGWYFADIFRCICLIKKKSFVFWFKLHWSLTHLCASELGHHWLRQWHVACLAPGHYLNQCRLIVNCTLRNNRIMVTFIQENAFENCCLLNVGHLVLTPVC